MTVLINESFESGGLGVFNSTYGGAQVVADGTAPNGSYSIRFTYPAGTYGGISPDTVSKSFTATNEIWVQFYFKFSSGYDWNSIMNKLVFIRPGASGYDTNHFVGVRSQYGEAVNFSLQHNTNAGLNQTARAGSSYAPTSIAKPASGTWHKITVHLIANTPGTANGTVQLWLNDTLMIDRTDMLHLVSGDSGGFRVFSMDPVYGGGAETINSTQYLWFDDIRVQTTSFGEEPPAPTVTPPSIRLHVFRQ